MLNPNLEGWTPLPESADERAAFDRGTKLHGDVRLNIAHALRTFALAHPGGSYADVCQIMANEVVKLQLPAGVRVGACGAEKCDTGCADPMNCRRPFGVMAAPARLLVTLCELRDGDGLTHCAMLHHEWQRPMDGMCIERRADKAEVEAEAAEWREFLAHGVRVECVAGAGECGNPEKCREAGHCRERGARLDDASGVAPAFVRQSSNQRDEKE